MGGHAALSHASTRPGMGEIAIRAVLGLVQRASLRRVTRAPPETRRRASQDHCLGVRASLPLARTWGRVTSHGGDARVERCNMCSLFRPCQGFSSGAFFGRWRLPQVGRSTLGKPRRWRVSSRRSLTA